MFGLFADSITSALHSMIFERHNETHNHVQPSEMLRSSGKAGKRQRNKLYILQNEEENKLANRM
jgi:hypothetical protein